MRGQRLSAAGLAVLVLSALATPGVRLRPCRTFGALRRSFFKLAKQEFQLLDLAIEFFRVVLVMKASSAS